MTFGWAVSVGETESLVFVWDRGSAFVVTRGDLVSCVESINQMLQAYEFNE